ncbi:MAG: hypothetical protein ACO1QB_13085 [Verrucomicrobiales bacterium]
MSMGSPGDHPITDLINYGKNAFPDDIGKALRLLHAQDPSVLNVYALDAFDWIEGKDLEVGRAKLKAKLLELGI